MVQITSDRLHANINARPLQLALRGLPQDDCDRFVLAVCGTVLLFLLLSAARGVFCVLGALRVLGVGRGLT